MRENNNNNNNNNRPQFINYYYLFICMYVTKYENIMFDIEKQKKKTKLEIIMILM